MCRIWPWRSASIEERRVCWHAKYHGRLRIIVPLCAKLQSETTPWQLNTNSRRRDLPEMKTTFVMITSPGPNRDLSKGTREQPFWQEHAEFIDRLVAEGFIWMGGPLVDEGGSLLFFHAADENEVREKMKNDPWLKQGILKPESIKRWEIFIDERK
jgi:uncharacterized protein